MCGIAGIACFNNFELAAPDAVLARMVRAVAHRGPDEHVLMHEQRLHLGFARLSLVDPAGGGQPMRTDDGQLVLVVNGEIYNHVELAAGLPAGTKLRTKSDCEVLLHLYRRDGLRFLDQVRGMFALVLWDRAADRLVFARDRFGIKPLYYHRDASRIAFASEMKALFEDSRCPRELDWESALADQALTGVPAFDDSAPTTWFRGINSVPAGTIEVVDLDSGTVQAHRYWTFPTYDSGATGGEADLIRAYRDTLASSVADSCMADVEIGLFLSGGIDSGAVAALSTVRPQTFTALNGSTLRNGDAEFAHRIAATLGLVNHQVRFDTAAVPGVDEWKRLVWLLETPLAGPESYYKYEMYRYVRAQAPGVKAMLLGGGSDEFNGGYSVLMAGGGDWEHFVANLRQMAARRYQLRAPALGGWWDHGDLPLVRHEALRRSAGADATSAYDLLFRWKYRDVQQYNCWHEDRTAAGNGIEARVPFLDHRLIELVAAVPEELRPALVWDKQILRRGLADLLPPEVIDRPKGPFFYGDGVRHTYRAFARMLTQHSGQLLDEALHTPAAREYLDADNIRAMAQRIEADPDAGHIEFVLRALNLGLLDAMTQNLPTPHVDGPFEAVPVSIRIADWDADLARIEGAVMIGVPISTSAVYACADNVMLLSDVDDPDTCFVLVDGSIEYVLETSADPAWFVVLRALDGVTPLDVLLGKLDIAVTGIERALADAIDLGIVVEVDPETSP